MPNLKKRPDGRYIAQIYLGRDETGKKKYKSVYGRTPAELKDKETAIRMQLMRGADMLSQRDSFAVWADDWFRVKEHEDISERQLDNYKRAVRLWKDTLDGYNIGDVRADDIERVLLDLAGDGYARRTVEIYRSAIRQILRRAVSRGVLLSNPAELLEISIPGRKTETRRALSSDEQQWVYDTPHRAQPVAIIMMLSGLRRGELAALHWTDVDLAERTITVNKAIEYSSSGVPSLKPMTKTAAGMRVIDIPQRLADYMATLPRENALVIASAKGGYMSSTGWTKLWKSYMRALNIKYGVRTEKDLCPTSKPGTKVYDMTLPPITMHWLRHTFCTLMYLAGVDVVQACAQMGHADIATTLRIYTHLDATHKRKSMDKLDSYLVETR